MAIAIIGWGSLIWDPRELPREGQWLRGGPALPIEFSRVSKDARLTLVLDEGEGAEIVTRFAHSPRTLIEDAINDLAVREGSPKKKIGYVDITGNRSSAATDANQTQICTIVRAWAEKEKLTGAVWTALRPNFIQGTGKRFTVENAIAYLRALPASARAVALHYIQSAPEEVVTPLRTRVSQEIATLREGPVVPK